MIFVDTGALLAKYIEQDQYHKVALQKWEKMKNSNEKMFVSNFVLDECFTLLARRASYKFAAETANIMYAAAAFEILRPDKLIEEQAIVWFTKFSDQKVSFTDCVSFALMKHYRVKRVFSFDRHFVDAGFNLY